MSSSLDDAQSAVSGALVVIWTATFMSYNLVPSARGTVEDAVAEWTTKVNSLDAEWIKTKDDRILRRLREIKEEVDTEAVLNQFSGKLRAPALYKYTSTRCDFLLKQVAELIDHVASAPRARASLATDSGSALERFIAERRQRLTHILVGFKRNHKKTNIKGPALRAQVSLDCELLAHLQLEANLLVDKDQELGSHFAVFHVHYGAFKLYKSLIDQALDYVKEEKWYRSVIESSGERTKRLMERVAPFEKVIEERRQKYASTFTPTTDNADDMRDLEQKMHHAYLNLIDELWYKTPKTHYNLGTNAHWPSSQHPILSHRRAQIYNL